MRKSTHHKKRGRCEKGDAREGGHCKGFYCIPVSPHVRINITGNTSYHAKSMKARSILHTRLHLCSGLFYSEINLCPRGFKPGTFFTFHLMFNSDKTEKRINFNLTVICV